MTNSQKAARLLRKGYWAKVHGDIVTFDSSVSYMGEIVEGLQFECTYDEALGQFNPDNLDGFDNNIMLKKVL